MRIAELQGVSTFERPSRPGKRGLLSGAIGRRFALQALFLMVCIASSRLAMAQSVYDLRQLSIEDLANVEIVSVSKRPETVSQAAAAIYVISADDIRRSGATSLPEALRLAPNLEVARISSQNYTISARGFNSANAADKLLVMIDGRTIYSPFFHDIIWNQHEVMLADIDRIEVVSGPGGSLWGANAVNGVINIITKSSHDTQGGLVDLSYGSFDQVGAGRWGGKIGENGSWRAYALGFGRGETRNLTTNGSAGDQWNGRQGGFRMDWKAAADNFTLQGDLFENQFDSGGRSNGGNLLGRWSRRLENGSNIEVQAYYDRADQHPTAAVQDNVNTFDLQAQHSFRLGQSQEVVWGLGQRVWRDVFTPINAALIVPASETLALTNAFAQDTIALRNDLKLTLGVKLEYNTFSGFEPMPNARLAWQATPSNLFWGAISRAVKTPSRLDRNLVIAPIFGPSPDFQSEKLIAYELGYRAQPTNNFSFSLSLFFNDYDDVRTTSFTGGSPLLIFRNDLTGHAYGAEVWGDWKPFPWWHISPGFSLLRKSLGLKPGGSDIAGIQTALGSDPGHQAFLKSYMDLPHNLNFYFGLRHVGGLALSRIPSSFEADARLGWQVTPSLTLSISCSTLLHAHHAEATTGFGPTFSVPRSVSVGLRRSF